MTDLASHMSHPEVVAKTSIRALTSIEARRYMGRLAIWVGLAGTIALMVGRGPKPDESWSGETYVNVVPLNFLPLTIGAFIAALRIGGTDRAASPAGVAEGAPLDADQRSLARLAGLVVPVTLSIVVVIVVAIASRVEGGFWIGEAPRRTNSALHSFVELMQPPLLITVAGASGVALGRTFRRRAPSMVAGAVFWYLAFGLSWAFNIAGGHALAAVQLQPMRINLPRTTDPTLLPADWFVTTPNEYDGWQRMLVHLPTVFWHNVYLLGFAILWGGFAIRRARPALGGLGVAAIGVSAQLIVSPF